MLVRRLASTLITSALCVGIALTAEAAPSSRVVQFAKGSSSATLKGSIKGYDYADHKLRARSGQTLSVSMKASNPSAYFNVLPPGSTDVAIHVGSTNGNDWTGTLDRSGEFTIRVYLMRNEARRGAQANYTLNVGITGAAARSFDAKVPGTPFHATGEVPCTMGTEAPKMCPFGVIRGQPGSAEVRITLPGGLERTLLFSGQRVTAPSSQSVKADRQGDEWTVEVDDLEHYRISDAVVNGG
jgi:hypothetical protein